MELTSIASLIVSPFIGAIGGMFQQWTAYKRERAEIEDRAKARDHEKNMAQLTAQRDLTLAKIEQTGRERQAAVEGEFALLKGDLDALRGSMAAASADALDSVTNARLAENTGIAWLLAVVDAVRKIIRPALTVFLVWANWELSKTMMAVARATNGGMVDPETAGRLLEQVVVGMISLGAIAVGWWFGSRGASMPASGRVFKTLTGRRE